MDVLKGVSNRHHSSRCIIKVQNLTSLPPLLPDQVAIVKPLCLLGHRSGDVLPRGPSKQHRTHLLTVEIVFTFVVLGTAVASPANAREGAYIGELLG